MGANDVEDLAIQGDPSGHAEAVRLAGAGTDPPHTHRCPDTSARIVRPTAHSAI